MKFLTATAAVLQICVELTATCCLEPILDEQNHHGPTNEGRQSMRWKQEYEYRQQEFVKQKSIIHQGCCRAEMSFKFFCLGRFDPESGGFLRPCCLSGLY